MKYLITIIRFIVGGIFILSGFVKLVDPKGTSYKLNEYFAPDVLNLPSLLPYTLEMSYIFVVVEVVLGVLLLLGIFKKFTLTTLLSFIIFFAFLTFYSAYFDKVKDCGCFGDFIKFKPWESFYKDVLLGVLILVLIFGKKYIRPLFSSKLNYLIASIATLASCVIAYIGIAYLPILDFRPFAKGENIIENMKTHKNPVIQIMYTLKNTKTGDLMEVTDTEYTSKWWKNKDWELQEDNIKEKTIDPGIPARIHDFVIGDELNTEMILKQPEVYLIINYDPLTKDEKVALDSFIEVLKKKNKTYYILTSLPLNTYNNTFELDGIVLKTIIRSSPGVVLVQNEIVKDKWHWKQLPTTL